MKTIKCCPIGKTGNLRLVKEDKANPLSFLMNLKKIPAYCGGGKTL